jgi:hypothetical protein
MQLPTVGFVLISQIRVKDSDAFISVYPRKWPTLALELGYNQSYDDLRRDMELLLEGSQGRIGLVILIKLEPVKFTGNPGDLAHKSGFVEIWKWDQYEHQAKQRGERLV